MNVALALLVSSVSLFGQHTLNAAPAPPGPWPADGGLPQNLLPDAGVTHDGGRSVSAAAVGADGGGDTDAGEPAVVMFRAGIEWGLTSYPSGPVGGQQDLLGDVTPLLGIDAAEDFSLEVGATFRFRIFDDPPAQRADDIGGFLRRADWDEPSDFGQIIRSLRISGDDSVLAVRAGRFRKYSLGFGHLLRRYSNQDNPDYHPAGAWVRVGAGPIRVEAFASDMFGGRILAGEAVLDFGRLVKNTPEVVDRYHVAYSLAHDFGAAGGETVSATLMHLDVSAVLYRSSTTRAMLLTGAGLRAGNPIDVGVLFGGAVETALGSLKLSAKAELRKQNGGFRQGFFGPGYELSRFAGTGFTGVSLLDERLPDSFSGYAEVRMGVVKAFSFDAGVEYFAFGRADLDAALALETFGPRFTLVVRAGALAMGMMPRYSGTIEARVRLFRSFYLLGYAGTVFVPQSDSTLSRGGYGGIGAGFDVER